MSKIISINLRLNFSLLRSQKNTLLNLAYKNNKLSPKDFNSVRGLIHLIDNIQDYCVDKAGFSEKEVFDI